MPSRAELVGADLGALWLCAVCRLPELADTFQQAKSGVSNSEGYENRFSRPGVIPGTPGMTGTVSGPAFAAWNALSNELESMIQDSVGHLMETSDALLRIVEMYADADEASARELDREKEEYASDGFDIRDDDLRPDLGAVGSGIAAYLE